VQTDSLHRRRAFTIIEVVSVLAVIVVLAVLLLPTGYRNRGCVLRSSCVNNLKQASLAYVVWVHDQDQRNLPFWTPFWSGGTQVPGTLSSWPAGVTPPSWLGLENQVWFQFAWVSNQLESPKALVCPSDRLRKPAGDWSDKGDMGFLNASYRNQAVSYTLWVDAGYVNGNLSYENCAEYILLSDRHLSYDGPASTCSSGIAPVREVLHESTVAGWQPQSNFGHGGSGNMAFLDGSIASVTTPQARALFVYRGETNGALHYMTP
jgi:prepilin-type processing-associated H-X9-DG protein